VESIKLLLTQFTDETITISLLVLILFGALLIGYWIYNRRKFQELTHQIPASVVKNYLDTIIQNSTALKSSLFRGGGLDIGDGVPSVIPVGQLPQGNVTSSGANPEEINQKNAEIALLKRKVSEKEKTIEELEKLLAQAKAAGGGDNSGAAEEIEKLQDQVSDLKEQLAKAKSDLENMPASGGGDEALQGQLESVTKERDEYKDRLTEYEIIEDELANLKRLQQENEQLKKSLAELQGGAPAPAAAAAPEPEEEPAPVEEPVAEEVAPAEDTSGEDLMAQMAAAMNDPAPAEEPAVEAAGGDEELGVPANQGQQKSAEELLSEFEKMLG